MAQRRRKVYEVKVIASTIFHGDAKRNPVILGTTLEEITESAVH